VAHCGHRGGCEDIDVTQKYPPAWSDLKYPWQRAELFAFLADAQNPSLYEDTSEVKFLMNFIFDDHDFKPAARQLGWMLLDRDEVEAIAAFVAVFDAALGPREKSLSAITAGEWGPVATEAARARECLPRQGEAWFEE
jgi:hypothetical protein